MTLTRRPRRLPPHPRTWTRFVDSDSHDMRRRGLCKRSHPRPWGARAAPPPWGRAGSPSSAEHGHRSPMGYLYAVGTLAAEPPGLRVMAISACLYIKGLANGCLPATAPPHLRPRHRWLAQGPAMRTGKWR
jgi:hypothetical protein